MLKVVALLVLGLAAGCGPSQDEASWDWAVETCRSEHLGAEGIVTNTGDSATGLAQVVVAWYDDEGFVVANTHQLIDGLPPDGSTRFSTRAPLDTSATSCEVIDVRDLRNDTANNG